MSPLMNKLLTDTSVLPSDILSLQGYDFFQVVEHLTSETIADLLRIQAIRNVRVFMLVPDISAVFDENSVEINHIRNQACFHLKDNTYIFKSGIQASLQYLRELFATKLREHYYPNNKQQIDPSNYSDDNVSIGKKRPASFPNSEQISNKRGRK